MCLSKTQLNSTTVAGCDGSFDENLFSHSSRRQSKSRERAYTYYIIQYYYVRSNCSVLRMFSLCKIP